MAALAPATFQTPSATVSCPTSPAVDSPRVQDGGMGLQNPALSLCPSSPVVNCPRNPHEVNVMGFQNASTPTTCSSPALRGQHDMNLLGPGFSQAQLGIKRRFPGDPDENVNNYMVNQVASTQRRKESHNATEQKRRQKINDKLNELRQLLPNCREHSVDKATILNEAIEVIRKYFADSEAWQAREMELKRMNQELLEENDSLARAAGLPVKKDKLVE